jgi:hypothetical protein
MRRIRRHLNKAQFPVGKTLATFDFKALPTLPRARVEALAAGDWLDGGGNLIAIRCPAGDCMQSPRGGNHREGAIAERGQFRHRQDAHSVRYRPCPDRGRPPRLLCQNQRSGAAAPGGATRPRSGSGLGEARHARPDVGGRSFPRKARFSASTSTTSPTPTRIRPKPASFSN